MTNKTVVKETKRSKAVDDALKHLYFVDAFNHELVKHIRMPLCDRDIALRTFFEMTRDTKKYSGVSVTAESRLDEQFRFHNVKDNCENVLTLREAIFGTHYQEHYNNLTLKRIKSTQKLLYRDK